MCHKNNLFLKLKSRERLHIKQLLTLDWLQLKEKNIHGKQRRKQAKNNWINFILNSSLKCQQFKRKLLSTDFKLIQNDFRKKSTPSPSPVNHCEQFCFYYKLISTEERYEQP